MCLEWSFFLKTSSSCIFWSKALSLSHFHRNTFQFYLKEQSKQPCGFFPWWNIWALWPQPCWWLGPVAGSFCFLLWVGRNCVGGSLQQRILGSWAWGWSSAAPRWIASHPLLSFSSHLLHFILAFRVDCAVSQHNAFISICIHFSNIVISIKMY